MDKHSERDSALDNALRSSLRRPAAAPGPCLDAETMAAWAEGTLPSGQAAAVEAHLAACTACQETLAVFAQTAPPAAVPESLWQRWHLRWAVPITAAAAAVSIWIAIPEEGRRLDDAFTQGQPGQAVRPSAPEAETASRKPPAPEPAAQENAAQEKAPARAKSEPPPADALSRRETRSDAPSRSPSEAREREQDAVAPPAASAPAAPAAAAPQQQARPLSDAAAGVARQSAESFAQVETVSPDGLVRWRVQPGSRLERSTTQGKTWDAVSLPQGVEPAAVRAPGAATAIVTATDGRQFRTDDQGKTWYLVQP